MAKIKRSELDAAEKKYRGFVDERDKIHEQVRAIVEEKKVLYDQKDKLFDDLNKLKRDKEALAKTLHGHKTARNEMQRRAKDLIMKKKQMAKGLKGNVFHNLESLQREFENLEMKQQTSTMSIEEENKLIESIRRKYRQLGTMKEEAEKRKDVEKNVKGVDDSIDGLFKGADEQHEQVLKLAAQIKAMQEQFANHITEIGHIIAEIKKKQDSIGKLREQADDFHARAMAMKEKVIANKKEKWAEINEGRQVLREHHKKVRDVLDDKKKLDEALDTQLADLFKKGKIEL